MSNYIARDAFERISYAKTELHHAAQNLGLEADAEAILDTSTFALVFDRLDNAIKVANAAAAAAKKEKGRKFIGLVATEGRKHYAFIDDPYIQIQ